jgi:hypothetical protein
VTQKKSSIPPIPPEVQSRLDAVASTGVMVKVFPASRGVRDFLALAMRESTNEDAIDAAIATDALLSPDQKENIRTVIQRERFECAKLTIAAWCTRDGEWVIVDHQEPFTEPNGWSQKSMFLLSLWFQDLNAVEDDDAKKTLEEAIVIGQPPPRAAAAAPSQPAAGRGR